jgi:HEPN domain-containing protein
MEFRIDPDHEISYRIRLAKNYLRDAEEAFLRGDYRSTVASSQLAAENAAKAIIAVYRIPSWSHDPSNELRELLSNMPMNIRSFVEELAEITESLAPEYGRATYGEPFRSCFEFHTGLYGLTLFFCYYHYMYSLSIQRLYLWLVLC